MNLTPSCNSSVASHPVANCVTRDIVLLLPVLGWRHKDIMHHIGSYHHFIDEGQRFADYTKWDVAAVWKDETLWGKKTFWLPVVASYYLSANTYRSGEYCSGYLTSGEHKWMWLCKDVNYVVQSDQCGEYTGLNKSFLNAGRQVGDQTTGTS